MQPRHFTQISAEIVRDCDTALGCFIKLNSNKQQCFLFESMQGGEHWARYSFIGLPAHEYFTLRGHRLAHFRAGTCVEERELSDPLAEIRRLNACFKVQHAAGLPRFCGGLVGYFGYECVRYIEKRLAALPELQDNIGAPDVYLLLCTELVVYDNLSNRVQIICHYEGKDASAKKAAQERLKDITRQLETNSIPHLPQLATTDPARQQAQDANLAQLDGYAYKATVDRCREHILAGDIFQVVPSHRASLPFTGDTIQLYRALRLVSPSPYMYYLRLEGLDIVGASPETMVRLEDGLLTVRPIAGTALRGVTQQEDEALAAGLLADPKECAEHNMLVDLGRNDLGRIGMPGSIRVEQYMQVEYFSHVMHLVSTITARLGEGLDAIDALCSTLPAGTLAGAPKIRAMEIINAMEPVKRGVYSGAIGYLDWRGNLDTAIPIRTFVIANGQVHIQAGGGIVADSEPEKEWQETLNKRRALFRALALVQ